MEAALNIEHFKDFKPALLSRPVLEWYQQQQELLALLPARKRGKVASPLANRKSQARGP